MIGLRGMNGRLRGLGYSYQDLIGAFGGQEDCSPFASDCVARQTQRMDAVNAMWLSDPHSGHNTTENYPVPSISWSPDTSAAAVRQFMSNQPVESGRVSYGGGPVQSVAQLQAAPVYAPVPGLAVKPKAPASSAASAPGAPALTDKLSVPPAGFSLGSIPWWGWALGVGAAVFAFGGQRGR